MITVRFTYVTGLRRPILRNARLLGSWNNWVEIPLQQIVAPDGCPAFTATVSIPDVYSNQVVTWGVRADGPVWSNAWAVPTEINTVASGDDDTTWRLRHRNLHLPKVGGSIDATYYLTNNRRLGAHKVHASPDAAPDLVFSVWAPNAEAVHVVFGLPDRGYIAEGHPEDVDSTKPVVKLHRATDGVWVSGPLSGFDRYVGAPYMFRITTDAGTVRYRSDIYSRWQYGRGEVDPARGSWDGSKETLDGRVSCSVIIDLDAVRADFQPTTVPAAQVSDDDFWRTEFTHGRPVPTRVEDLVIYELHMGALGYDHEGPGTLADAIALIDHLDDLGVNAVELMPLAEYGGRFSMGYGNSHHFAIESSSGGRDKLKHFVRACHQRGIAVIQDVVYNHFSQDAERAESHYDSDDDGRDIYYWYEGSPTGDRHGYLQNGSSGRAPRYHEELVRQLFASSAAALIEDFHIDGLRVDLTQAIHADNCLEGTGESIGSANMFGQKMLREWSQTLRLIRPSVMLFAEDHSGWDRVTQSPPGGLGFDATWLVDFYHDLIGDTPHGDRARLLHDVGYGDDRPLNLSGFASRLPWTQYRKVVYVESHDEAGNSGGDGGRSARTAVVAINGAPLVDSTRRFAEARCRVAAGLAMLTAGTPMFFMGEEIVATKPFLWNNKWDDARTWKEDLHGERAGLGAAMFRCYQDLIGLRLGSRAIRSSHLDVIHVNDSGRVIAFVRGDGADQVLVVASFSNHAYLDGYAIEGAPDRLADGTWLEIFNSDAGIYGGANTGNGGAGIWASGGRLDLTIPANGLLVLQRQ